MIKLGGVVLDSGPRGTLYEVCLPEVDPEEDELEEVVRYVRVQDASTDRSYLPLRAADQPDGGGSGGLELQ
jgi:hypothetical protein